MNSKTPQSSLSHFAPTRWTLVLRARGEGLEARSALSELCEAYYQPVFRFLRREGRDEETARELTQEFFTRLLTGNGITADPERGRFRSYLLGAVKHFLADHRKHLARQKRGSGVEPEPLQPTEGSGEAEIPDPASMPTDHGFDRDWALALMERALARLAAEFQTAGKEAQFQALKPWLVGESPALPQAQAAQALEMSESAVKVAIHRLRQRFRTVIRQEVAQTTVEPAEVETELRYLVEVLGRD